MNTKYKKLKEKTDNFLNNMQECVDKEDGMKNARKPYIVNEAGGDATRGWIQQMKLIQVKETYKQQAYIVHGLRQIAFC